jgi:prepilin-type N-terminal cleavage/methylation domain-containing protein
MISADYKKPSSGGFTLVEMTVSLMLLSFITLIGYQALMYGLTQWQQGNDKMAFHYNYFQAVSWIRLKVGSSEKVKDTNTSSNAYLFRGDNKSIEFVARYSRTRKGGLYINKILFNQAEHNITVNYYLHHPDNRTGIDTDNSQGVELLGQVSSLSFLYYGNKLGEDAKWHDQWKGLASLPQLVKIEIQHDSGKLYESTIHISSSNNS